MWAPRRDGASRSLASRAARLNHPQMPSSRAHEPHLARSSHKPGRASLCLSSRPKPANRPPSLGSRTPHNPANQSSNSLRHNRLFNRRAKQNSQQGRNLGKAGNLGKAKPAHPLGPKALPGPTHHRSRRPNHPQPSRTSLLPRSTRWPIQATRSRRFSGTGRKSWPETIRPGRPGNKPPAVHSPIRHNHNSRPVRRTSRPPAGRHSQAARSSPARPKRSSPLLNHQASSLPQGSIGLNKPPGSLSRAPKSPAPASRQAPSLEGNPTVNPRAPSSRQDHSRPAAQNHKTASPASSKRRARAPRINNPAKVAPGLRGSTIRPRLGAAAVGPEESCRE